MQLLRFRPIVKQIRWGGSRLGTVLGKPIADGKSNAESWEIADHGDDQSVVTAGDYQGWTLSRLVTGQGKSLLGQHSGIKQFPLLIKFLDACDSLSVQVHPNDRQARVIDPSENGKTEAWVIIDAAPKSKLFVGLKPGIDETELRKNLDQGTVTDVLHSFHVSAGDCVFIPAGTAHAIGAGILLAEVQQSSDLTFRLFDWGRVGVDGQPRELHIEPAIACTDFQRGPVDPVEPLQLTDHKHDFQELVRSDYFVLRRHLGSQPFQIQPDDRFHILIMLRGSAEVVCGGESSQLLLGQTLLVPAERRLTRIVPSRDSSILQTYLPQSDDS